MKQRQKKKQLKQKQQLQLKQRKSPQQRKQLQRRPQQQRQPLKRKRLQSAQQKQLDFDVADQTSTDLLLSLADDCLASLQPADWHRLKAIVG